MISSRWQTLQRNPLGHQAGDAVLRQVAARLASCLREEDVVARLGGDEFVTVLSASPGKADPHPEDIARRLIDAVNEPVLVGGKVARVGCSIGVAAWPQDGVTLALLLEQADRALYAAKLAGRNCVVNAYSGNESLTPSQKAAQNLGSYGGPCPFGE